MKVYIDKNNMCHTEHKEGYVEAEHSYFDDMPSVAIEFFKFIPEQYFIQCTNSLIVDSLIKQKHINELEVVKDGEIIDQCVWNKDNDTFTEIDEPIEEEIIEEDDYDRQ